MSDVVVNAPLINLKTSNGLVSVSVSAADHGTYSGSVTIPIAGVSTTIGVGYDPATQAVSFAVGPKINIDKVLSITLRGQATFSNNGVSTQISAAIGIAGSSLQVSESLQDAAHQVLDLYSGGVLSVFSPEAIQKNLVNPDLPSYLDSPMDNIWQQSGLSTSSPDNAVLVSYESGAPAVTAIGDNGALVNATDLARLIHAAIPSHCPGAAGAALQRADLSRILGQMAGGRWGFSG